MRGAPLEHEYSVELSALDSHPLGKELGLSARQTARYAFRTKSEFVLETGSVVWDAATAGSDLTRSAATRMRPGA